MTESPAPRRGVPIWAQIIVWIFLVGLLAIVGVGLQPRAARHRSTRT